MMRQRDLAPVGLAVGLFLAILGCKFATLERFGSDLPLWDEWDAGAKLVFLPYLQDRLELEAFFIPHNEHRVLWTKLLALGLVIANGQWDARLECVVNAALHGAFGVGVFLFGLRAMPPTRWWIWWVAILAIVGLPLGWHNVVSGFHSQHYFLLVFSALTIALLIPARPARARWWLGVCCGAAALVSVGAGLLAPAAVLAVLAVDGRPREVWRRHGVTLAVCAALVALGWFTRVEVGHHAGLKATSAGEFLTVLRQNLQWPSTYRAFALLTWLPWGGLAWRMLFRRGEVSTVDRVIVAGGVWVLLVYAATAYARGAGGGWPAPRHADNVGAGIAVNVLALLRLLPRFDGRRVSSYVAHGVALCAALVFAKDYLRQMRIAWTSDLPRLHETVGRIEANTRAYVATGDEQWLATNDLMYPNADVVRERLSHPELRALLPVSVREPVALDGTSEPEGAFVARGVPPALARSDAVAHWGSHSVDGAASTGEWRSSDIPPSEFGYLRLEVAARPGAAGETRLELSAGESAAPPVLAADDASPPAWRPWVVAAPRLASRLIAHDRSEQAWLAFTAPREMATGSYWTARLEQAGMELLVTGTGLAILSFLVPRVWRRRENAIPRPDPV